MNSTALFPRKRILNALGYHQNASRSSWSHDDGERVFFDAWTNRYDHNGNYPMCTPEFYPRPDTHGFVTVDSNHKLARRGHVMWLAHLDLVLAKQRQAVLINPVPRQPSTSQGAKGAKGWLPRFSTGIVFRDNDGIWFEPKDIITLNLDEVVDWPEEATGQIEDRRLATQISGTDSAAKVAALLIRHIEETNALLKELGQPQ